MVSTKYLFLLFALLLIHSQTSLAQTSFRPRGLVLPVSKDTSTGQYIVEIKQRTPQIPIKLTLNLGGKSLWVDCSEGYVSSTYKSPHCGSAVCSLAQSICFGCEGSPKPGCNNNSCSIDNESHISYSFTRGEVAQDVASLQSTDGSNPGRSVSIPNFIFGCGQTYELSLSGLASGVVGMAGLGNSKIGMPYQLATTFSFKRKFAICLGSSKGVVLFGDGPYNFLPRHDLSSGLTYTPLLTSSISRYEYFIGVTSIRVNNANVPVNSTLLKFGSDGFGGTRITDALPYMLLDPTIYEAVTNAFVKAASNVRRVKAVEPFSICYNSKDFSSTRLGLGVPLIELVLQSSSVTWKIYGANSMVDVGNGVACLGILNAYERAYSSIVIGAHQIQDNLLQFDLAASRVGFSSLLHGKQTSCGNFNFTSVA